MTLALTLAAAIGVSLGLLGSGGSIITVPMLVYIAGFSAQTAVGMSLAIVGGTSLIGAGIKAAQKEFHWQAAGLFSVSGVIGALVGTRFTAMVSPRVLMLLFGGLMTVVAIFMLKGIASKLKPSSVCHPLRCASAGLVVGILTGFLGVGGGFVIVPAMILFARLSFKDAVGTSLGVIAMNSLAGMVGHLILHPIDLVKTSLFLGLALAGMVIGLVLNTRIQASRLQGAFAVFVLAVAAFVIIKNI
jgi:uncharacterized membrane protein YfcA